MNSLLIPFFSLAAIGVSQNDEADQIPAAVAPGEQPAAPAPTKPWEEAHPHLEKARAALAEDDSEAGLIALAAALAIDPDNLEAMEALALIHLQKQEPGAAVPLLQRLLALDPYNDDARLALARAHFLQGDRAAAETGLTTLLERHPEHQDALGLQTFITSGESAGPSPWQPLVRVAVDLSYDTNVALENGALIEVAQIDALTTVASAMGGVVYRRERGSLSLMGSAITQTSFDQGATRGADTEVEVNDFLPSMLGVAAVGQLRLGPTLSFFDARYREVFTNTFTKHIGRGVSPSLGIAMRVHEDHQLRLLLTSDLHQPFFHTESGYKEGELNGSLRSRFGDTMLFGDLTLVVEAAYQHNFATRDARTRLDTGFDAIGGAVYAQYDILADLTAFALVDAGARFHSPDPQSGDQPEISGFAEGHLSGQVGLRFTISLVELHAEYGIAGRLADGESWQYRNFLRHQVTAGARVWYP